eukprot:gene13631-19509_t
MKRLHVRVIRMPPLKMLGLQLLKLRRSGAGQTKRQDASSKNARAAAAEAQKERRRANRKTGLYGIVFGMGL